MGKIIVFHSYKGGTGKTLLSTNLGATLVKRGENICLLDLDFRAPSLQAAFKINQADHWLNDYLNGVCEIDKVLIDITKKHGKSGKFLVGLANPTTEAIREMSAKDRKWEMKALGRLLSLKSSLINDMHLDKVILDTSPGIQYSSINAIVSADIVLVVTTLDSSDLKGTQRMTSELYNLFEKKTGIVINKVPFEILSSKKEREKFYERLSNLHKLPIINVVPCFCEILRAGGAYIFSEENQEHPFTKALEIIAEKIEKF